MAADGTAPSYTDANRLLAISTPLGADKLLLTAVSGEMEISRPFTFSVTLLSEDMDIVPTRILNAPVTIWISRNNVRKPLHGLVRRFWSGAAGARGLRSYRAEIVPWLWFLSFTSDCRIFQNMSFPDIAVQLFGEYGFADYELSLVGTYPKLEYCVQYRESAFAFISRWLEKLGIFYFFRHEANRHVLVLSDAALSFKPVEEKSAIYGGSSGANVTRWEHAHEFRPGAYARCDYDYESPSLSLLSQKPSVLNLPGASKFEMYDYPGAYLTTADGDTLTRTRLEEDEARHHTVSGESSCHSYVAGGKFTMGRHDIASEQKIDYVLLRVVFEATDGSVVNAPEPAAYSNAFTAFPSDRIFRPERRNSIPFVHGPQTAIVVGGGGDPINTDAEGRVKVQFYWDRRGKHNDGSSCWIRVSQNWAGAGWGGVFIPHVGHEVVVSFLEGDPDRPLITGRVYNGANKGSLALPANKTQCTIRDYAGNEIVLEGKPGVQDFRTVAVKDMNEKIANDYNKTVGRNRTKTIVVDETTMIGGNRTETVNQNEAVSIALARVHAIGVTDTHTVGAAHTRVVGGLESITVGANRTLNVGMSHSIEVGSSQDLSVADDDSTTIGANQSVNVGKAHALQAGTTISIGAGDQITLQTGSASITMSKNGDITISGKTINVTGSGNVILKGQKILQN